MRRRRAPGAAGRRRSSGTPPPPPSATFDRAAALARLREGTWDVVVVGGGITGCGVALDAASRGLRTALVEATDFGAGTSSKSSKLVHGGLRYLQQREYRLVYDALAERQRLLRNAPHLVQPVPFLIPLFGRDGVVAAGVAKAYSSALWLYDLTGGLRIGHRHRRVDATTALRHVPSLRTEGLVASFVYWDAQADDARLTLAVARTAAAYGAAVVNAAPVSGMLTAGDGGVGGVRLADGTEVRARVVVNAGGVWSGEVAAMVSGDAAAAVGIRPAKGVHVTVPADRLPCDQAVVLSVPGARRSVFVVPWDAGSARPTGGRGRFTYIGTTDTAYEGPLDDPACTAADVDDLLAAVNHWTSAGLTPADVTASWAGLRPLVAGAAGSDAGGSEAGGSDAAGSKAAARTADLSRRHRVVRSGRLVTVTGGKLTTYRSMAADTVDEVERVLGRRPRHRTTASLRLVGADGAGGVPRRGGGVLGVPTVRAHLLGRYGAESSGVAAIADADGDLALPLVAGLPYLRAEAVWAVRREMAVTLLDVLARRTRALILDRRATAAAAPSVAALIGPELGWSAARTAAEVATVEALVAAEVAAGSPSPACSPTVSPPPAAP